MKISIIAALTSNAVIGNNGDLLWRLPNDMNFFKIITSGHPVIMGRKTWDSIPEKYKPLPNRTNIIMSKSLPKGINEEEGYYVVDSMGDALNFVSGLEQQMNESRTLRLRWDELEVFIAGGGEIYKEFLDRADMLYLTEVETVIDGDTKFPEYPADDFRLKFHAFTPQDEKNLHDHHFYIYERKKSKGVSV